MKQAIVTGGAGGIGRAITELASRNGYRVGVLDVDLSAASRVAGDIPEAVPLCANVTDEEAIERALDEFGHTPDLLVNNAGIVRFGSLLEQSPKDFTEVVETNLIGAYVVGRSVAARMVDKGAGCIVNITSINGVAPASGSGAYAAAKAGLAMLTQQMSIEWGPSRIRVNSVAPGFIDAGMSAPIYANADVRRARGETVPLRELGQAEDVADAVMFLASEKARYITGQNLVVDGGVSNAVLANLARN